MYKSAVCSLWGGPGRYTSIRDDQSSCVCIKCRNNFRKKQTGEEICRCRIWPVAGRTEPGPPCLWFCSLCGPSACFGSSDHAELICYSVPDQGREKCSPADTRIYFNSSVNQWMSKVYKCGSIEPLEQLLCWAGRESQSFGYCIQ